MALQLARRIRIVLLMVPVGPESGFRERVARLWPFAPGCGHLRPAAASCARLRPLALPGCGH